MILRPVYYSLLILIPISTLIKSISACPIPFDIQSKCRCAITEAGRVYIYCARKQLAVIPRFNNSKFTEQSNWKRSLSFFRQHHLRWTRSVGQSHQCRPSKCIQRVETSQTRISSQSDQDDRSECLHRSGELSGRIRSVDNDLVVSINIDDISANSFWVTQFEAFSAAFIRSLRCIQDSRE